MLQEFPHEVAEQLKLYVYRLIDPRNGETFYVGKGRGNRVFTHAAGAVSSDENEDEADLKLQRIKDIKASNLEVGHVIHRFHIESEELAYEIEAALIDAYPGLTNRVSGHGSGDYGCRHAAQIILEYAAETFVVKERTLLISIGRSYLDEERSIYDAVRGVWRINESKAKTVNLVLAHRRGLIVGAFEPVQWFKATKDAFPWLEENIPGRIGFEGRPAKSKGLYLGKRVPDIYRRKGAANPVRFLEPEEK